jgi:hypothetical protein
MTESEVLALMRAYYASLFPKTCPHCERCFSSLEEYVAITTPAGRYMSYDIEGGSWTPDVGTFALANCPCGDTLSLTTDELEHATRLKLLEWIKTESTRRAIDARELLDMLRVELRRRILSDAQE